MTSEISAATTAEFISQMHAERAALHAFIRLLETEQQALLNEQTEQIHVLADTKTQMVHELTKLVNARKHAMLSRGIKIEHGSMETWLQTHTAINLPAWHEIRQLASHAQHMNRTNGALIQVKMRLNQQTLTMLHNATHSANGLYGPDGQPNVPVSGRILDSV
ncbi:Flagellar biosynthesis protein flgN [Candidatus Nitrotoga sp. HW29]|uniref:flagella synthesis protein FlgN n=1 Tax=Candidatus Nitrotoga sp. HW29 TaxID=2886963 RepID=UPI001EF22F11|nr:flagellar protein FlgN [Candidatus Nitrotoga sp. HW29]CAH1905911.1 Flagellar biosynthesis protein flgN [Candidatus Nitrotoga sp. HW29]